MTTYIKAHLMDCTSRTGRHELESAFVDFLLAAFGSADAVAAAKARHDEAWARREEYPCGSSVDDEVIGLWMTATGCAMRDALASEGWLGINDAAHMEVTVS